MKRIGRREGTNRNPRARPTLHGSTWKTMLLGAAAFFFLFAAAQAQDYLPTIAGTYDINELKRLLEVARESGFTEEQIREVTVEDEEGNVINAWAFIQEYERKKKEEEERLAAERAKVYLSPKDIMDELDKKQPGDIDKLREKLLFVE